MKIKIFILLLTYGFTSFAQTEPIVELIFEDATGKKDTTFVGISEAACDTALNASLGEEQQNGDFPESIFFKVIGAKAKQNGLDDIHTFKNIFSKKIFFSYYQHSLDFERCVSGHQLIVFKCRIVNFPLKITWNWLIQNEELDYYRHTAKFSIPANDFNGQNNGTIWAFSPNAVLLSGKNEITFQRENLIKWEDSTQDFLLLFSLQHIVVGNDDLKLKNVQLIQPYPNPTLGSIRLNLEEPCEGCLVQFYDAAGTFLQARALQHTELNVTTLPKGLILGLITKQGLPIGTFRFLKTE